MPTLMTAAAVRRALAARASAARAVASARFFRTGPGEYGEGDRFIGVTVPLQREVARAFATLSLVDCRVLLRSPMHEHRLTAVLILIRQFESGDEARRARIYRMLLGARRALDNWDLVDTAAPRIFGAHLSVHPEEGRRFERFLASPRLWERRIAVLTAGALIPAGQPELLLGFAARTLTDRHDLMHKAVGWMLREVGKRDVAALRAFLDRHAPTMPRTMLRYAIERLSPVERRAYLAPGTRIAARTYTLEQITESLKNDGLDLTTGTLKSYMSRAKAAKKRRRRTPLTAPSAERAAKPSTVKGAGVLTKAEAPTKSGKEAFLVKDKDSY